MPAKSVKVKFSKERDTKNTVRFAEEGDPEDNKIGTVYLKKATVAELGSPEDIEVTVTAK